MPCSHRLKSLVNYFSLTPSEFSVLIYIYRSGTVNSNTVNSKFHLIRSYCEIFFYHFPNISCLKCTVNSNFHLIRSYCEIFFYHFPNISCLKCTVNSNFHLIRSKTLVTNDFQLTVPNLTLTEAETPVRQYFAT